MTTLYPGGLDTPTQLKNDADDSTPTSVTHEVLHNNVSDAIIAIETVLGTSPSGSYASVKAAIADIISKTPSADQIILPSADHVALIVKQGNNTFLSNLFEARDSTNNIKFYVDRSGNINAQGISVAGSALAASNLSNGTTGTGSVVLAASPTLTGNPLAPTQTTGNSSTRIATTAFVAATVASYIPLPTTPATNSVLFYTGAAWSSQLLLNANVATGAAIAYSKLALTGNIVDADIKSTAAIAISKLASYPADATKVLKGDGSWGTVSKGSTGGSLGTVTVTSDDFTNGQQKMLGLGLTFTTSAGSSGVVEFQLYSYNPTLVNVEALWHIRYGTGSAPANEGAVVGTAITADAGMGSANPIVLIGRISGLAANTTYWFDAAVTLYGPNRTSDPQGGSTPGVVGGGYVIKEI